MKYLFLLSPSPSDFVRVIETHITFYALSEKAKNKISFKILNTKRESISKSMRIFKTANLFDQILYLGTNIGPIK